MIGLCECKSWFAYNILLYPVDSREDKVSSLSYELTSDGFLTSSNDIEGDNSRSSMNDSDINDILTDEEYEDDNDLADGPGICSINPISSPLGHSKLISCFPFISTVLTLGIKLLCTRPRWNVSSAINTDIVKICRIIESLNWFITVHLHIHYSIQFRW